MLYICFPDKGSLNSFKSALISVNTCDSEITKQCAEACRDREIIYLIRLDMEKVKPVLIIEWSEFCISVIPCEAYTGLGFYDLRKIKCLIHNMALLNKFKTIAQRLAEHGAIFIALGFEVMEPRDDIVPIPFPVLGKNVYALYLKTLDYIYVLVKRSNYVSSLLRNIEPSVILSQLPDINWLDNNVVRYLGSRNSVKRILKLFERVCREIQRDVFSEGDLICVASE